jgi:ABC-type transport system substrate-binding protein
VVVTYAATAKPIHLSPLAPYRAGDTTVLTLLQDTLLVADQSGGYLPRLAQSWAVSDDGTTYTFTLRRGQRWSDGVPFTAQDVVFTFNLSADPVVRSPQASRLSGVLGYQEFRRGTADALAGVTAVGADRVVVVLAEPDAGFLAVIGASMLLFILPEHVLERIDPAAVAHDPWWLRQDVGMGPFVLAEFKAVDLAKPTAADARAWLHGSPAWLPYTGAVHADCVSGLPVLQPGIRFMPRMYWVPSVVVTFQCSPSLSPLAAPVKSFEVPAGDAHPG